jgi:hypothetical protein
MTRITNFGRKRTYLEAGFDRDCVKDTSILDSQQSSVDAVETGLSDGAPSSRPKKKRKNGNAKAKVLSEKGLADSTDVNGIRAEGDAEAESEEVNDTEDVPEGTIPSRKPRSKKEGKAQLSKGQSTLRYCGYPLVDMNTFFRSCAEVRAQTTKANSPAPCRNYLFCMSR